MKILLSPAEFERRAEGARMTERMRHALRAIMVGGATWAHAQRFFGVTGSGILRAMRRLPK